MYFHKTPSIIPLLFRDYTWHRSRKEKTIYLTFDDGPVYGPTEFVLEQLAHFQAKATFFCVGDNIRKHPDLFQRIVNEGHAVANHTQHHLNGRKHNTVSYLENIEVCEQYLAGHNRQLFRPPYGRLTMEQSRLIKKNYQIVMWDVLSADFDQRLSPEACLANSIKATQAGSIVLFHDSYKSERLLHYTLPGYLEHFSQQGFQFHTL